MGDCAHRKLDNHLEFGTEFAPTAKVSVREIELTLNMHILFVDDMPDTCEIFRLAFGLQGHTVRLASNGEEAVDAVREEQFDAIVTDVEMPAMNGWEAVKKIRTLPNGTAVPIIMFTAYGRNEEDRMKALDVGADDLLQKPILPQELLKHIQRLVH